MPRKSLIIPYDRRSMLELLTDEQRGKLMLMLMDYSEDGAEPDTDDRLILMCFEGIRGFIDSAAEEYEKVVQARRPWRGGRR